MKAAMKLGTLAATSVVVGMALDKSRGDRFNASLTPGTAIAVAGFLPGLALAMQTVRMPGPASVAFMGATVLGTVGATVLGTAAGAVVGRSLIGFAPPA